MKVSFIRIKEVIPEHPLYRASYELHIEVAGVTFIALAVYHKEELINKFGFTEEVFNELLNN